MSKHALTLTHCEPERAVGHQDTADAEPAADAS
jgi:hypothetical protein